MRYMITDRPSGLLVERLKPRIVDWMFFAEMPYKRTALRATAAPSLKGLKGLKIKPFSPFGTDIQWFLNTR